MSQCRYVDTLIRRYDDTSRQYNDTSLCLFELGLLLYPLRDLALLLEVSVEDVRFPGPEVDQGRKIVELVLFVDAVVGNLDQVDVGVVKLKIFNLFLERI